MLDALLAYTPEPGSFGPKSILIGGIPYTSETFLSKEALADWILSDDNGARFVACTLENGLRAVFDTGALLLFLPHPTKNSPICVIDASGTDIEALYRRRLTQASWKSFGVSDGTDWFQLSMKAGRHTAHVLWRVPQSKPIVCTLLVPTAPLSGHAAMALMAEGRVSMHPS